MDNQTAFNRVCEHLLLKQKVPSVHQRPNGMGKRCAYRGDGGESCAVGCLLPDKIASKLDELEDALWSTVCAAAADEKPYLSSAEVALCKAAVAEMGNVDPNLLIELQAAHDRRVNQCDWLGTCRTELKLVALHFYLVEPEVLRG